MNDKIFGELEFDCGFNGTVAIDLFDEETVDIIIQVDDEDEGIAEIQYEAYEAFKTNVTDIQKEIAEKIIEFYNNEEKGSYGSEEDWPDIETVDDLLPLIHVDSIVIPNDYLMDDGRTIYVLFNRDWGGEDYDDNGVAVRIVDETVEEAGYKDIAF